MEKRTRAMVQQEEEDEKNENDYYKISANPYYNPLKIYILYTVLFSPRESYFS